MSYHLGLNPCIYGMNYHDPSAALFKDNNLICAVEEERFTGKKSSPGDFPKNAVKACLSAAGIKLNEVSTIGIGYNPELRTDRYGVELLRSMNMHELSSIMEDVKRGKIDRKMVTEYISSLQKGLKETLERDKYLTSNLVMQNKIMEILGTREADVRFFDHHKAHAAATAYASGFKSCIAIIIDGIGEFETISTWRFDEGKLKRRKTVPFPYSIGYFYAAITSFLGFRPWRDEGTTMALVPYGERDERILKTIMDMDIRELVLSSLGDSLDIDEKKVADNLASMIGIPRREYTEEIKKIHKDIAWAAQYRLTCEVMKIIDESVESEGIDKLCFAGGVFLNCKLNMEIRDKHPKSFFLPVSGDGGLSLGAALLCQDKTIYQLEKLNVGPSYDDSDIKAALQGMRHKPLDIDSAAEALAEGKIILWFDGGVEYGPRTLGSRSILADPRDPAIAKKVNDRIKHREPWRPFACSVLEEHAEEVLKGYKRPAPFMIEAYEIKNEWKRKIAGVIHSMDGTTRPQTVNKDILPRYHSIIHAFYKLTGVPLLLNTSMNDKNQPIILKPEQAVSFFKDSAADILIMGDQMMLKDE